MRSIVIAGAMLMVWPALAQTDGCMSVEDDLDRLACYDKASGRTPTAERVSDPVENWTVQTETSKMTDQTNVFMWVSSEEEIDCGWNRGAKIRLFVRCFENTTSLIFQTECHMASSDYSDYGDITYRIDDRPAETVSGTESTNNRSLGLWSGGRSIPVIKEMFGGSTMIARMTPFNESPFTAEFDIRGLEAQIAPLRDSCHW